MDALLISPLLARAKLGIAHGAQIVSVKVDKAQAAALRDEIRRQRIIPKCAAAEMRGQAADVGERVDLDAQQFQARFLARDLERDPGEPQEAGGIGRGEETV